MKGIELIVEKLFEKFNNTYPNCNAYLVTNLYTVT